MENKHGALAAQQIKELIEKNIIRGADYGNIQPSSLDLTISQEIYKMKGVFLPRKGENIEDLLKIGTLYQTDLDKPLEYDGIYLIRLNESLHLPAHIAARSNNKSSSGRINLQARLLMDGVSHFDTIPAGYQGNLWLLVSPQSFPVKLHPGNAINQIRFFQGDGSFLLRDEYFQCFENHSILFDAFEKSIPLSSSCAGGGITMTVDLSHHDVIGYKCSPSRGNVLDFNRFDHDPQDFFEILRRTKNGHVVLRKHEFYIFVTREAIRIPHEFAVEMVAYDPSKGEFRSHYAGFFDPGWGYGDGIYGMPAVLEVLTNDNDFILRDGQPICKMMYEKLLEPTEIVYGSAAAGSHYFHQRGPKLSKHFAV